MPDPQFTIIIPTRNGILYLPYAIESVLSQDERHFELIVSDNHSSDGTAEYLQSLDDPRLRCIKPPTLLSMTDHFEFAVAEAKGKWVTTLGDDDGVMPFFFQHLRLMCLDSIGLKAIVFRRAYYFWAGCKELHGDWVVIYRPYTEKKYKYNVWSLFLCICSVIDYAYLPQLYTTGLVQRDFIDEIRARSGGRFFHGESPDAASAVALALNASRHYRVEEPTFWTGTSPKSTGFSYASSDNRERAEEFKKLSDKKKRPFLPPQFLAGVSNYSVLLYETLIQHPLASPLWRSAVIRYFLFAGLIVNNPDDIKIIQESYMSFRLWKVRPFVFVVKYLTSRHLKIENSSVMEDASLSTDSEDRARFPTLKEASAFALGSWRRMRQNEEPTASQR